jgi:hypothetical protein
MSWWQTLPGRPHHASEKHSENKSPPKNNNRVFLSLEKHSVVPVCRMTEEGVISSPPFLSPGSTQMSRWARVEAVDAEPSRQVSGVVPWWAFSPPSLPFPGQTCMRHVVFIPILVYTYALFGLGCVCFASRQGKTHCEGSSSHRTSPETTTPFLVLWLFPATPLLMPTRAGGGAMHVLIFNYPLSPILALPPYVSCVVVQDAQHRD